MQKEICRNFQQQEIGRKTGNDVNNKNNDDDDDWHDNDDNNGGHGKSPNDDGTISFI